MPGAITVALMMAAAVAASPVASDDIKAATSWVKLVDTQQFDESWTEAGVLFRSHLPQAQWASTIQSVRAPLGTITSRSMQSITKAATLPGAPDGEYEIMRFQTRFDHKRDAVETIVLAREGAGWKVDGYFIR